MSKDRKAATDAYKNRKVVAGIFAVTCTPTGERWVGSANDLSTIKNRIWFSLGLGSSPHKSLQQAWNTAGGDGFQFEELERLKDDLTTYARDTALKARAAHWREELGAAGI